MRLLYCCRQGLGRALGSLSPGISYDAGSRCPIFLLLYTHTLSPHSEEAAFSALCVSFLLPFEMRLSYLQLLLYF